VKADAAFARTTGGIVLNTVAFKVGHGSVVELDRDIDYQRTFGALQGFGPAGEVAQIGRDTVNLLQVDTPRTEMIGLKV